MSRQTHLRTSPEFRRVYANGKRYDGRLMSAFVVPNDLPRHRIGITASRKATGNAVQRNRAKRLLREMFRQSFPDLESLGSRYDWVFNAKRALLDVKVPDSLDEFGRILSAVARDERTGAL